MAPQEQQERRVLREQLVILVQLEVREPQELQEPMVLRVQPDLLEFKAQRVHPVPQVLLEVRV